VTSHSTLCLFTTTKKSFFIRHNFLARYTRNALVAEAPPYTSTDPLDSWDGRNKDMGWERKRMILTRFVFRILRSQPRKIRNKGPITQWTPFSTSLYHGSAKQLHQSQEHSSKQCPVYTMMCFQKCYCQLKICDRNRYLIFWLSYFTARQQAKKNNPPNVPFVQQIFSHGSCDTNIVRC